MSKELEEFIRQHKDQLDMAVPSALHSEKFEAKLREKERKKMRSYFSYTWKVAASIVIVLGIWFLIYNKPEPVIFYMKEGVALKDVSPELAEVEFYYTAQITNITQHFDSGTNTQFDEIRKYLEFLEGEYNKLKLELEQNYGDERIINAMIQNYRLRLEVLEKFLAQKSIEKQKKEHYGKSEI